MQNIQLTIPNPCYENWQNMITIEKGKFCGECNKIVHDFTKSTDREIVNTFQKDQKLCGRFLNTQLERELYVPKEKKSIWLATIFFGMISLSNTKLLAQEKPKVEQNSVKPLIMGKIRYPKNNNVNKNTVSGVVSDANGALPGVNVTIKGTQNGVSTNFEGKYFIEAKEGAILVFSYMGFEDETIVVGSSKKINVTLKEEKNKILEMIIVGSSEYYHKPSKNHAMRNSEHKVEQHTFLGRQFHKIGNFFRKKSNKL